MTADLPTDVTADRVLDAVIGIFELAFPDRVRGYYLRGSYATGTPIAGSDLDLFVVFKDRFREPDEAEQADRLRAHCTRLSPILLEVLLVSEHLLRQDGGFVVALDLKLATRLLHGDDIRPDLPEFSADRYVRAVAHAPYHNYAYPAARRNGPLSYPLRHLDPDGRFYGYDEMLVPGPDGTGVASTKLLVASVGWTATALVARQAGRYVADKAASVALYRQHVADRWTDLVVGVYERCRNQWQYRLPAADRDRRVLRELCDQALAFQNHYLSWYRVFLLDELRSGVPDRQVLAARRLRQIRFLDREVADALQHLLATGPPVVREAAGLTLDGYPLPG